MREVERQCRFQIVPLFRKRLGQTRETFAPLAKRPVLAFDMRCASAIQIGHSAHRVFLNRYETAGTVAFAARLDMVREQLDYVTVVRAIIQASIDCDFVTGDCRLLRGHD
jgi:hypothetical protein